jgi:hypothetical protein
VIPDFSHVQIAPEKVRDYLLSPSHPVGRYKAVVFSSLGYRQENWQALADDLARLAALGTPVPGQLSPHGAKYEVSGMLSGPVGRSARIRTAWIVRSGELTPRFITAYPE